MCVCVCVYMYMYIYIYVYIYIYIYMNTQRDMNKLNFAVTLYTLQLDAYTVVPFLRLPRHRPLGLYGHIFIAIAPAVTRLTWAMIRVG